MAVYSISFVIQTSLTSVDFITDALNIIPTDVSLGGTCISSKVPESGVHLHSTWIWEPFPEGEDNLMEQLNEFCSQLKLRTEALQQLQPILCYVGVSVMVVSNSASGQGVRFDVSSQCLAALGELGIEIWFDVYP